MTSSVNFKPYTFTSLPLNNKETHTTNTEKHNINDNNTQVDTVEIQGKIKNKPSTGSKIGIAIGGVILAGITGLCLLKNKKITKTNTSNIQEITPEVSSSFQEIAQKFNQIYRKNFSKTEITTMVEQYKKIFKLDSVDEFANQLFNQIKKDAGYGDKDISLFIHKCEPGTARAGGFSPEFAKIQMDVECTDNKISNENKKILFGNFVHEFQHVFQHEQAYNADFERYEQYISRDIGLDAIISQYKDVLAEQNEFLIEKMGGEDFIKDTIEKLINKDPETVSLYQTPQEDKVEYLGNIKKIFGEPKHYDKNSEEYKKGIQYLENWENYIQPTQETMNEYGGQLVEKEAYEMQAIATKQISKLIGL